MLMVNLFCVLFVWHGLMATCWFRWLLYIGPG